MKLRAALIAVLLVTVVAGYAVAQEKGGSVGKIITVGEDRIVVGLHDGKQMTFEVRSVPDGDTRIADRAQMAEIKTLKTDQMVHVKWHKAHDGHYYIEEMFIGPADGSRWGIASATVITADEERVVVADDDGGQITLERAWFRRRNQKPLQDPYQGLVGTELKPGDRVVAMWDVAEGTHYMIRGISKIDPEAQALAAVLMQAQMRESYNQINELHNEINELKNLINRLLKQLEPQDQ